MKYNSNSVEAQNIELIISVSPNRDDLNFFFYFKDFTKVGFCLPHAVVIWCTYGQFSVSAGLTNEEKAALYRGTHYATDEEIVLVHQIVRVENSKRVRGSPTFRWLDR